jgi:hypothetical protein
VRACCACVTMRYVAPSSLLDSPRTWRDDAAAPAHGAWSGDGELFLHNRLERWSAERDQAVRAVQRQQQPRLRSDPDRQVDVERGEFRPDPVWIGVLGREGV